MIDGTFQHHDSTGGGGLITDGDTQWMTAGSGLLHIERPPDDLVASGGLFHGVQLWVNLPAADKFVDPRYQDIRGGQVKLLRSPDGGALLRLIAGDARRPRRPGRDPHADHLRPRHRRPRGAAGGAVVARLQRPGLRARRAGHGRRRRRGRAVRTGQLAVLGAGDHLVVAADADQDSHTPQPRGAAAGRAPHPASRWRTYGPFVMNTRAELAQAIEDFQAGRMGHIPADHLGMQRDHAGRAPDSAGDEQAGSGSAGDEGEVPAPDDVGCLALVVPGLRVGHVGRSVVVRVEVSLRTVPPGRAGRPYQIGSTTSGRPARHRAVRSGHSRNWPTPLPLGVATNL